MSLQALREKRAAKAKALHDLVNKADWNPEKDQPVYDAGMQEIDDIDAHIKRVSDMNEKVAREAMTDIVIDASLRAARDNQSAGAAVYAKWLRGGDKALNAEDWEAIRNEMSSTIPAEGGITIATDVATSVLEALKA